MAGLSCAAVLAEHADCHVFERLPVPGGEAWEEPGVAACANAAARAGMRFLGGTQVVRFHDDRLLAVGQHSTSARFAALVVATGHRPLTRTELGIRGPRCAGVLPATVAAHLVRHGVGLGRVAVVGDGRALPFVTELLARGHDRVTLVLPDGRPDGLRRSSALELYEDVRPVDLGGSARVEWLGLAPAGAPVQHRIRCDSVVLAYGRVPYRNVEGAVFDAPRVVFAQAADGSSDDERSEAAGLAAAQDVLRLADEACAPEPLRARA